MKKQNKLLVASLLAVPAVAVAGAAQAADTETALTTIEMHNDFIDKTSASTVESTKNLQALNATDLQEEIIAEMASYNKGFTITYKDGKADNYKQDVEAVFKAIKEKVNTVDPATKVDYTMLYGTFNNARVEATEIKNEAGAVQGVKLKFSMNYFMDATAKTALENLSTELTNTANSKAIITSNMKDVEKLKAIHDYVVKNSYVVDTNHNLSELVLNGHGSSNAYALLTYSLIKKAYIDDPGKVKVEYVAGLVDGSVHSWNVVTLGGKQYHFDAASDDNITPGSPYVSYRYFLASNEDMGNRKLQHGATIGDADWGNTYDFFKDIVNPADADGVLYYADAAFGGELKKVNLDTPSPTAVSVTTLDTSKVSSSHAGVVYYKHTSTDTAIILSERLYFINNSVGNFLYSYDLKDHELTLVDNVTVNSIRLEGHRLIYQTPSGQKTILLNNVQNFNERAAKAVIDAIDAIDTVTGAAVKTKVLEAREKFNALTEDQRALVTNLSKLESHEATLSGTDTEVAAVIAAINALDVLDAGYIAAVKLAANEYNYLTQAQKNAIYNYSILNTAVKEIAKVEELKGIIAEFVGGRDISPFSTNPESLKTLDTISRLYDLLLPALKQEIPTQHLSYLNSYKEEAVELRLAVQKLVNEVNVADANSSSYLDDMTRIISTYNAFYDSQKLELTAGQKSRLEGHIAKVGTQLEEVAKFETDLAALVGTQTSVDTATLEENITTSTNVTDAQNLEKIFDAFTDSQKSKVSQLAKTNLTALLDYISDIVTDPAVIAVNEMIAALDHTKPGLALPNFINEVTSADSAYMLLGEVKQLGVPQTNTAKLQDYKNQIVGIIEKVTAVRDLIEALSNTSTLPEVIAARDAYTALTPVGKQFIPPSILEKLTDQETRFENLSNQEKAQLVIDAINALKAKADSEGVTLHEVLTVNKQYDDLPKGAKGSVTNYPILEGLLADKEKELAEQQAKAKRVIDLIAALTENSTAAQVMAALAAYEALDEFTKELVTNYDHLLDIQEKLKDIIEAEKNALLALELDNEILSITEQTPLERVLEIKKKYDDAVEAAPEVKALVREKVTLDYWVERKTKENEALIEQAKKDAQLVIDRIDKISPEHTEAHIRAIRVAYEALSDLAKTYVKNLNKLEEAEANIVYENTIGKEARAEAAAFDAFMEGLSRKSEKEDIREARKHYNRLSDEAKKFVTTYNKLKRLEEMFSDKDYEDLFENYYPHYVDDPKPGGVEPVNPEEVAYDPLYIPDETTQYFAYTEYEEKKSTLITGGFIQIDPKQLKHNTNKTITFTASNNVEITFPVAELKNAKGAIGVTLKTDNEEVIVTFTENNRLKSFTDTVLITVPFDVLGATSGMKVEAKAYSGEQVKAVYKVDGTKFIIGTKQSGTFTAATTVAGYTDLVGISESRKQAIRELGQRGIVSGGTATAFQPKGYIVRKDIAVMVATALNLTTTSTTKYTDVSNAAQKEAAQAVLEAGVMRGATATTFKPYNELSREQAAIIVANVLRYKKVPVATTKNPQTTSYNDANVMSYEGQQSVAVLELAGILNGTGNFQPNGKMTRGEFAEWLYKALKMADAL